jgi:uncharacterized protein YaiI (UPF0178 family)
MEEPRPQSAIRIFVDADACPVKPEVYRVAERYGLKVYVVANSFMAVPRSDLIERVIVSEGPDIADDWIVERVTANDVVVTADVPLAGRAVKKGATVIGPTGKPFTEDSIGMALATRDLLTDLRSAGATTRGPAPLSRQDISRFLSALDLAVTRLQRLAGR